MAKYVIVCRAPGYARQEGSVISGVSVAKALLPCLASYYTSKGYRGTPRPDGMAIDLHDRAGLQFGTVGIEEIP